MSDVSATRSTSATRQPARTPARNAPQPDDVRAMSEAFARAGRGGTTQQGPQSPLLRQQGEAKQPARGKAAFPGAMPERTVDAGQIAGWRAAEDRSALDRRDGERSGDQGFAMLQQPAAAPNAAMIAQMPNPQVDPSGFAQMLADLWTRENGKGAKDVRVRFGGGAWPVTGARLVRSADGLLDVTIEGGPDATNLPLDTLAPQLREAGLTLGRLTISDDGEA